MMKSEESKTISDRDLYNFIYFFLEIALRNLKKSLLDIMKKRLNSSGAWLIVITLSIKCYGIDETKAFYMPYLYS